MRKYNMGNGSVSEWYDSKRKNILLVCISLAVLAFFMFFAGMFINIDEGIIIGKPGMPEFKGFYKTDVIQLIYESNSMDMLVAAIIVVLFICVRRYVNDKLVSGVWLYNIALTVLSLFLGKHLAMTIIFFGRLPFLGIFYVAAIIFSIFVFILNIMHYRKNKGLYAEHISSVGAIAIVIMAIIALFATGESVNKIKTSVRELEDEYAANEYMTTYRILNEDGSTSVKENNTAYIGIKYVNLFNDSGRIYTTEEMDEAIYNLVNHGGNSYYCEGSWYPIMEFNNDLGLIEEKYDFSQYSYAEEEEADYDIFRSLVLRRLNCLGQESSYEEMDAACEYVHDVLISGKPMEELGADGEEILLTFSQEIKAGAEGCYDIDVDYKNAYATIQRWSRVAYMGSEDEINKYYPHGDSEFTFEEGCVYKASIKIYPEITYCFNEDMEVVLDAIEYDDIYWDYSTATASDSFYSVDVWIAVGDEVTREQVEILDTVDLAGMEGVKTGDDIYEAQDISGIGLKDNLVCSEFLWSHYTFSDYTEDYYSYCNPQSDYSASVKQFEIYYPVFQAELDIYADTGYIFAEDLTVTYNGKELGYATDEKYMPNVQIPGYYTIEGDGHIKVRTNFYRIRFEGENGTVTASYDFATEGTRITLTPVPDEGYRFVGYETSNDLTVEPDDSDINIIDNEFIMKSYPVVITAIFEKE